ncbi:glycosyltransferase family 4 protein [Petroclostridium sp. X23]|uniref:glycosyltransferase family 4 protein n=1 Tax=Petroclostridium sp. X23 TaxID=3045146 RepID=UPI0024AE4D94|nr:glycosyltransferase family 4 protein [Petroclostridium sp. X23]WHH58382.1 glycosyltransferase family 4 protein [Petroclostridium sp. X23]
MKALHLISGGDSGGAKTHVFSLLGELKNHIDVKIICFTSGIFYQEILDMDIPVDLFLQKHRYDLSVVKKLVTLIRDEKYEIIHTHGARANFIAAILKRYIRLPIVTTVHSDYLLDFDGSLYRRLVYTGLNMLSLKYMDYYIAVSENFREMLISRKYPPHKVFTVYNGIDFDSKISYCSREQFLTDHGITVDQDDVLVGIIGRLDKVKGHEVFVKAAAEVASKAPQCRFMLAGDGNERKNLEEMAEQLGIRDKVVFLGFIDKIYDLINALDINTLTSYSESFPYVLLEGARLRKPTISSAVGGIPDLIKDGQNGYLFKSTDHSEMAEKLLKLVNNKDLRKEFGQKLYERARDSFSNKSLANRHIEIYREILKMQDG